MEGLGLVARSPAQAGSAGAGGPACQDTTELCPACSQGYLHCWMSPESNKISGLGWSEIRPLLLPLCLVYSKPAISQSTVGCCSPQDEEQKQTVAFEQSQFLDIQTSGGQVGLGISRNALEPSLKCCGVASIGLGWSNTAEHQDSLLGTKDT